MKLLSSRLNKAQLSLLPLFVASAGVMLCLILTKGSDLLLQTEVLDKGTLSLMKYQEENSRSLFLYVLKERCLIIPLVFLLSTTYLTAVTVYGITLWYGAGLGAVLGVAILRYGIRGVILVIAAGFPQYLLYIPAIIIALRLCMEPRIPCKRFFTQLFILEVVVIIGCFLESYVNLMLVEKIIKIFITG